MRKIRRRQSDPTWTPPSAQQASSDSATFRYTGPPTILNSPSTLEERAATLARMTFEVGLAENRALSKALEDRVGKLMVAVADEKVFRRKNEERLGEQEKEIQAIKAQSKNTEEQLATQLELLDSTMAFIDQYIQKAEEMKDAFADVMKRLEHLENSGDDLRSQPVLSKVETRSTAKAAQSQFVQQQNEASMCSKRARIKETIRSTQRWNLEHRRTALPDSQFATEYFKKQAKRDPEVARIIQQTLKQRIRRRQHGRLRSRPQSLEEFCQHVQWRDILETAEEVLARGEEKTLRMLK